MSVSTPGLLFQYKRFTDLTETECAAWSKLHNAHADLRKAFLSIVYASHVAECGAEVVVVIGYLDAVPVWFIPLQRCSGWLGKFGVFEPVGSVMSDYFGAVGDASVLTTPEALLSASSGKVSAVLFTHLDETQTLFGLSGGVRRIGLRTRIGSSQVTYWEDLRIRDKKLVSDTERREKKLVKEHGPLTFEWKSSARQEDLELLIELKKEQYRRTGKHGAPLFEESNRRLLNLLVSSDHPDCEGVLSILRCGDKLVSAHLGLRCHEVLHVWFPVYAQDYASYSPGRILMKYMIRKAQELGVQVFDRGEGDTQAKRDFANEEHSYLSGVWHARSLRGLLARIAISAYWRL